MQDYSNKPKNYEALNHYHPSNRNIMGKIGLLTTLCVGTVMGSDGTNERGFIPPPRDPIQPPAPPRTASSAETLLACCCCPVTPMARTEAKKPPQPPVLVTKIRDERIPENY